ncbi:hypothetical protein RI103_15415 [Paraburkholderia sp. FT54]|uniref:hypothetical protein n=1 Tax=Paraburkholderia sp. FT54 TaxID=3074437 RepID=UPI0028776A2E|nr:hypothetical protein [Paraburkholderia sp. FT54]WNC89066.1 hypothetical protein RI103_15415 [Paraburkholderia sp. FT54]
MGSLDDLIQRGACQIIQQTIEAELATLLQQYDNVKTRGDRRAVVTPIAPGPGKVCNRSASGSTFNSMLLDLK